MMKTLYDLKPGEKAKIKILDLESKTKRRFLDMGLTYDKEIEMKKVAPLGDPIEVKIRNYSLSFRKNEAKKIHVY